MPTMATELSDSSRQRASHSISSLVKRAGRKFSSRLNTKTRLADQHNPCVLARLVRGHLGTNDFNASHKSIEAPARNQKIVREASLAKTFEEQRRGMLSFQDPFVMLGAGDISTPTAELGWLPDNEYQRKPRTARNMSNMLSNMHKIVVRLPDSKIVLDHPNQVPCTLARSRFSYPRPQRYFTRSKSILTSK